MTLLFFIPTQKAILVENILLYCINLLLIMEYIGNVLEALNRVKYKSLPQRLNNPSTQHDNQQLDVHKEIKDHIRQ